MRAQTYLLDISRLLARAKCAGPTGIDRVELAYAEFLLEKFPDRVVFCAIHPFGRIGGVQREAAEKFIITLSRHWTGKQNSGVVSNYARRIKWELLWRPVPTATGMVHMLVSHHHLMRPRPLRSLLRKTGARFIPMVHDIIPITHPEYARPKERQRHMTRMSTVAELADAIIVPSEAVHHDLKAHLHIPNTPIWSIPHGVSVLPAREAKSSAQKPDRPYFVYLSTIEPRKNHLTLLNAWRRLIDTMGHRAPILVIIGKRGWENENIVDILDRSEELRPYIVECNTLDDAQVMGMLLSCRALLFPTLVEGYGLPLAEALSMKVPALCSDIPVLREVGGDIPEYVDPINGAEWAEAISVYTYDDTRRDTQLQRMKGWSPLGWEESVAMAIRRIECLP